jgi:hypothetical protein
MNLYCLHIDDVLSHSLEQINMIDTEDKKKTLCEKDMNKIFSKYPHDLFKTLFKVIDLLAEGIKGKLLYELFKVYTLNLDNY